MIQNSDTTICMFFYKPIKLHRIKIQKRTVTKEKAIPHKVVFIYLTTKKHNSKRETKSGKYLNSTMLAAE